MAPPRHSKRDAAPVSTISETCPRGERMLLIADHHATPGDLWAVLALAGARRAGPEAIGPSARRRPATGPPAQRRRQAPP